MAIELVRPIRKVVDQAADMLAKQAVAKAKANAPVDSGKLAGSIVPMDEGIGHRTIMTNAVGSNGVAYPARIEAGDPVTPRPGNKRGLWYHGRYHKASRPSKRSHFMKRTMGDIHI